MFVLESQTKQTESVMKTFILMLFATASLFAQNSIHPKEYLSNEDKCRFLDSLNKYRRFHGVVESKYSFEYETISSIRIRTIQKHIKDVGYEECEINPRKHLHFNFLEDFSKFNKSNLPKGISFGWKGECTISIKYNINHYMEKDIVSEIFSLWKNSEDHWKNMLDGDFNQITLSFQYEDGIIISVLNSFEIINREDNIVCKK